MKFIRGFQFPIASVVCVWLISTVIAPAESLKAAAEKFPGLHISAAVKPPDNFSAPYANTLRLHLQPSPENATKWAATQPEQNTFNWTDADAIARFARAGGEQMRGHTLMWHQSIPDWLTGGNFSTTQIRDFLFQHIDAVAGRYRGSAWCWDVVNEAFNENGTLRSSFWYNAPGIGYDNDGTRYIEEAFRRTALADPSAKLIYNDYGIEMLNAKSDAVYAMAQDFLNRGVPLQGIGFQMHISGINYSSLRDNFKRFNDLVLALHITEMDVRIPIDANGNSTPADLNAQAEVYWNVLSVALGQPRFEAFQTWGFTDKDSWIPGFYPGFGNALPFDKNYRRKPAYWAIWNALANQAEKLPVVEYSSGDSTNVFHQETLSAGAGIQLQANDAGDFMTLSIAVPFPGSWDVKVGFRRSGASGKFQLAIAPENSGSFHNVGSVVDLYDNAISAGSIDLGTNDFSSASNWNFRFTVAGKNANASDYNLTIDYIRLTPVQTAENNPPTVSNLTDKTIAENTSAGPFPFSVGDTETPATALTVQAISMNTDLLPSANIQLGGNGANRTVTVMPAADQFGLAAVLLLVSDGTNETPETFILEVTQITNHPPVLSPMENADAMAGVPFSISLNAFDPDVPAQTLKFHLLNAPSNAVIEEASGVVNWRPTIAQSGTSHQFTIVVSKAGWLTNLVPTADVFVRDGSFADSNYGADEILTVKKDPAAGFSREAFLRFELPPIPGSIATAQLRLQPSHVSLPGTHAVALVTNDWNEFTLTWNTKPGSGSPIANWIPAAGTPVEISVLDALKQNAATNTSISLRVFATTSTSDGRVDYASRESAFAPQLSLFYTNATALSVTQSFWVNVIAPPAPVLSAKPSSNGDLHLNIAGEGGPDYEVQISTNLLDWATLFTTNGLPGAFAFDYSNSAALPQCFYRIQLGP